MGILKATVSELAEGVKITAGAATTIHMQGVRRIRLHSLDFDTSKCFVGPAGVHAMKEVKKQAELHPGSTLLLVGHTDASGEAEPNLDLSLERAGTVAAFLQEDADAWEAWFQDGKSAAKRWGLREIQMMLSVLPESGAKHYTGPIDGKQGSGTTTAVRNFQAAAGLQVDGIVGPQTRQALIRDYFKLDGSALPGDVKVVIHGCGESFPTGGSPEGDRRVEAFFFASPIEPPPPADRKSRPGAADYPKWLEQVVETVDIG